MESDSELLYLSEFSSQAARGEGEELTYDSGELVERYQRSLCSLKTAVIANLVFL